MASLEPVFVFAETTFEFLALNSIYSVFLAGVLVVVKLIIPRIPKGIEYGLWCLVLIRLVLPTDFSIIYSLGYVSNLLVDTPLPIVIKNNDWLIQFGNTPLFEGDDNSFTWLRLLLVVWLAISSSVAFKFIKLVIKLSNLLGTAHPVEQEWLDKIVNKWRREFEITRQVIVIVSDDFLSPFTFGVLSPVIFIPEKLMDEGKISTLEPIVAHELAHIKRRDAAWLVLQNILQIIYCLNPILWLTVSRLNSLREEICDQKVLATKNLTNRDYGKSLLRVLRLNIGKHTPGQLATFFLSHKQMFKKRIAAIGANPPNKINGFVNVTILTVSALFFLPLSWHPVSELRILREFIPPPVQLSSPFPENIREEYQAPVLLHRDRPRETDGQIGPFEIKPLT